MESKKAILARTPEVLGTSFEQCKIKLSTDHDIINYNEAKAYAELHKRNFLTKGTATVSKVKHRGKIKILILHPNPHDTKKMEEHLFDPTESDTSHDQRHFYILKPVY